MNAIREIRRPVNQQIIIDLPDGFSAGEVEVIIIPLENEKTQIQKRIFGSGRDSIRIHKSFYDTPDDLREYV